MIQRPALLQKLKSALRRSRVVALIGPRQCGKTTLARQFAGSDSLNYFDLEDPASLTRLDEPMTALRELRGIVVIDEIQRPVESRACSESARSELSCREQFVFRFTATERAFSFG